MAPQMDHGRPAAGHGDHVAIDGAERVARAVLRAPAQPVDAHPAEHLRHRRPRLDPHPAGADGLRQRALGLRARVEHHRHLEPRVQRRERGAIGVVVVGDDRDPPPRRHRVVGDVVAHRAGQHHPRHVVAGKAQRPFQRPGGGDDAPGADAPQALARQAAVGRVVGQRLTGQQIAVVVKPRGHGVAPQGDVRHRPQRGERRLDPRLPVGVIDRRAPAPVRRLFQHDDSPAAGCDALRGGQPGDTAAHHDDLGMGIGLFVAVGVGMLGRPPEAGGAADHRLEQPLPRRPRVDEGLVVEPGREEPPQPVVDRADVAVKARPGVLPDRHHPRLERGGGGALVRLEPRAGAEAEERVRLFRARGERAARAVILEAAPHDQLAAAEQRRGERVAGKARAVAALEAERTRRAAVDQAAALRQAEGGMAAGHGAWVRLDRVCWDRVGRAAPQPLGGSVPTWDSAIASSVARVSSDAASVSRNT